MTKLVASNLSVQTHNSRLLDKASIMVQSGELVVLLGPNGAGKTTLLRAMTGLLKPASGAVSLDDQPLSDLTPMQRARKIAYLPQSRPLAWPSRVIDVVTLGRFSHGSSIGNLSQDDQAAVDVAIEACDLKALRQRRCDTLSGGELARVHCARAFATNAPLLIADEPVAALDPKHQFRIMDLIRHYVSKGGGALVVLHDIRLAATYADRLVWMKDGSITADGPAGTTLTVKQMAETFGVNARIDGTNIMIDGSID